MLTQSRAHPPHGSNTCMLITITLKFPSTKTMPGESVVREVETLAILPCGMVAFFKFFLLPPPSPEEAGRTKLSCCRASFPKGVGVYQDSHYLAMGTRLRMHEFTGGLFYFRPSKLVQMKWGGGGTIPGDDDFSHRYTIFQVVDDIEAATNDLAKWVKSCHFFFRLQIIPTRDDIKC